VIQEALAGKARDAFRCRIQAVRRGKGRIIAVNPGLPAYHVPHAFLVFVANIFADLPQGLSQGK
jgi:hypothetical protein